MKLSEFTHSILNAGSIESKLIDAKSLEFDDSFVKVPELPARDKYFDFSKNQLRFPKGNFHENKRRAMALSSFANHELLAVEIMAASLVVLPHDTAEDKKVKLGIFNSLKDEQRHFKMYVQRMSELGFEFGDFPLNVFFWKYMKDIKDASSYFAVMSLTFEAANLDFAKYFEDQFRQVGDEKTADILDEVYKDEISHVALGVNFFNKWREDKSLWDYYVGHLPFPLTPARSKGQFVNEKARMASKFDSDFIEKLVKYSDDYKVTARRHWKR